MERRGNKKEENTKLMRNGENFSKISSLFINRTVQCTLITTKQLMQSSYPCMLPATFITIEYSLVFNLNCDMKQTFLIV